MSRPSGSSWHAGLSSWYTYNYFTLNELYLVGWQGISKAEHQNFFCIVSLHSIVSSVKNV